MAKGIQTVRNAGAAEAIAAQEEIKKRAARQAATALIEPTAVDVVTVRVLPMGDAKISMGVHIPDVGEAHYEKGETFPIARPIAEDLEARGFVEIQASAPEEVAA